MYIPDFWVGYVAGAISIIIVLVCAAAFNMKGKK